MKHLFLYSSRMFSVPTQNWFISTVTGHRQWSRWRDCAPVLACEGFAPPMAVLAQAGHFCSEEVLSCPNHLKPIFHGSISHGSSEPPRAHSHWFQHRTHPTANGKFLKVCVLGHSCKQTKQSIHKNGQSLPGDVTEGRGGTGPWRLGPAGLRDTKPALKLTFGAIAAYQRRHEYFQLTVWKLFFPYSGSYQVPVSVANKCKWFSSVSQAISCCKNT